MGKESKGKNPKTEAAMDIILAVGKAIIDILTERRKR